MYVKASTNTHGSVHGSMEEDGQKSKSTVVQELTSKSEYRSMITGLADSNIHSSVVVAA